jgi:hypothetical protein
MYPPPLEYKPKAFNRKSTTTIAIVASTITGERTKLYPDAGFHSGGQIPQKNFEQTIQGSLINHNPFSKFTIVPNVGQAIRRSLHEYKFGCKRHKLNCISVADFNPSAIEAEEHCLCSKL